MTADVRGGNYPLDAGTLQPRGRDRVVSAVTIVAAAAWVICFALIPIVDDSELRYGLGIVGAGFVLVSAAFPALRENHKRRRSDKLGDYIRRLLDLARACDDRSVGFHDTKKACDVLGNEMDRYVKDQFGQGAVEHVNNSEGISVGISLYPSMLADADERHAYNGWCRLRAARVSELVAGLHSE